MERKNSINEKERKITIIKRIGKKEKGKKEKKNDAERKKWQRKKERKKERKYIQTENRTKECLLVHNKMKMEIKINK